MIQTIYLGLNALLYILVAIWCALSPVSTAKAVGFELIGDQGKAEYIAVYGGLEFALGMFFLIATFYQPFKHAGLAFAAILYTGLVLFRIFALVTQGSSIGAGWYFFGLEVLMLIVGLYVLFSDNSYPAQTN